LSVRNWSAIFPAKIADNICDCTGDYRDVSMSAWLGLALDFGQFAHTTDALEVAMSRYLDWLLLAIIVIVSLASPLIVLEFVSGKY